jgi:dolichyl-diphosphooligosaccharide--protein glycosyltransferase
MAARQKGFKKTSQENSQENSKKNSQENSKKNSQENSKENSNGRDYLAELFTLQGVVKPSGFEPSESGPSESGPSNAQRQDSVQPDAGQPQARRWKTTLAAIAILCLCLSAYVRYGQYQTWKTAPEVYFSHDVTQNIPAQDIPPQDIPMMSTLDAYYWLRLAREYKEYAHIGAAIDAKGGTPTASYGDAATASNGSSKNPDLLRHFPEPWPYDDPPPLLSILVADVSSLTGLSVYDAGNLLVVLLSGLFIVPLAAYFFLIGSPAAGVLGGLTGTFSIIYFTRTSIGRIDNDMLNLFFLFCAALLTLLAASNFQKRKSVLYSAVLGIVMMLFYRWYSQPFFPIGQFFVLIIMLFIHRSGGQRDSGGRERVGAEGIDGNNGFGGSRGGWIQTILACSAAYIAAYGISFGLGAAHWGLALKFAAAAAALALTAALYYVFGKINSGKARLGRISLGKFNAAVALVVVLFLAFAGFHFRHKAAGIYESVTSRAAVFTSIYVKSDKGENAPGVYSTITEARKNTVREILSYVYSSPLLSAGCIFSFAAFFVFNWRWMLPFAPAFAMGLMSFNGANRFVMYLAPFAGAGAGLAITAAVSGAAKIKSPNNIFLKKHFREAAAYLLTVLFFIAIYDMMGASHVPLPSVPADVYSCLTGIRGKLPKNSGIFTWWDFGYAVQEAAGVATFVDGGYQPTELIHDIARALTSPDQKALHTAAGGDNVAVNDAGNGATTAINGGAATASKGGVYVLFTRDMLEKFPAIYSVAGWDKPDKSGSATASSGGAATASSGGSATASNGGAAANAEGRTQNLKGFFSLLCAPGEGGILKCGEYTLDMNTGLVNGAIALKNTVIANNGVVTEEKSYGRNSGLHLEILMRDNILAYIFVLDDEVYNSNVNQIYMLGRWDSRLFEEVFNNYPSARFFRVKKI